MQRSRQLVVCVALACGACRLGFEDRPAIDATLDATVAPPDAAPGFFFVGGTVSSPAVSGLVLQNNGADDLAIASAGPFWFSMALPEGTPYVVKMKTPPIGHDCVITNSSGIVSVASATAIEVICFPSGACPTTPITYTANDTFTLPSGCAQLTAEVHGGGGAGGRKNVGDAAAAGGTGGRAVKTLTSQPAGAIYAITIGLGGTCESTTTTAGGYAGGKGGVSAGSGNGGVGAGASAPPGGLGGAGSIGSQPGGAGGNGGYGGGGGGGGGDTVKGNSGGGATVFALVSPATELVIAGGGGGAGASDQGGDRAGAGGNACNGENGANGQAAVAGTRSGGGGGGGACACLGGSCDTAPTSTGGAGGFAGTIGGTSIACTAAQNGSAGRVILTFP